MINNKLFRGFTFDGVNSLDYDIYITGESVYNAPVRAVEKVSVPGRNGDLTIDQGRFENVPVTYAKCGCAAKTQEELAEKVSAFRNALCSRVGYKRLTDDYNKDEYRMAMYASGLEVEAIARHRMGTFDIVFDAKPQRFLYAGESPQLLVQNMTPKNPQTESGSLVSIEGTGADKVTSLVAQIEPVQAGSGDPSPSNVREITGRTSATILSEPSLLMPSEANSETIAGVTFTSYGNGMYRVQGTSTELTSSRIFSIPPFVFPDSNEYKIYFNNTNRNNELLLYFMNGSSVLEYWTCTNNRIINLPNSAVSGQTCNGIKLYLKAGFTVDALIVPHVSKTAERTTTNVPLGQTVYGGTVDVVSGVLKITHAMADMGTLNWQRYDNVGTNPFFQYNMSGIKYGSNNSLVCSAFAFVRHSESRYGFSRTEFSNEAENNAIGALQSNSGIVVRADSYTNAAAFKTAMNGVQLVYELATPQTYNLTAQQVELLTGNNNVWADTGDITITWGDDPYMLINPTLHASKPLLKVTGRGTLSVGDVTMTIAGTASQVLYIDCDIMETYSIQDGAMTPQNSLVTIDGYDYPVLLPGATKVTLGSGITRVEVTTRWWRV